jgi:hypothetical protein
MGWSSLLPFFLAVIGVLRRCRHPWRRANRDVQRTVSLAAGAAGIT